MICKYQDAVGYTCKGDRDAMAQCRLCTCYLFGPSGKPNRKLRAIILLACILLACFFYSQSEQIYKVDCIGYGVFYQSSTPFTEEQEQSLCR